MFSWGFINGLTFFFPRIPTACESSSGTLPPRWKPLPGRKKTMGPMVFFVVQFETWCKDMICIYIYINIYIYTLYIYMYTCLWIWLYLFLIGLYVEHRWANGILAPAPRCRVSYASKHLSGIPGLWRVKYHGAIPLALAWNLEKSNTTRMMAT